MSVNMSLKLFSQSAFSSSTGSRQELLCPTMCGNLTSNFSVGLWSELFRRLSNIKPWPFLHLSSHFGHLSFHKTRVSSVCDGKKESCGSRTKEEATFFVLFLLTNLLQWFSKTARAICVIHHLSSFPFLSQNHQCAFQHIRPISDCNWKAGGWMIVYLHQTSKNIVLYNRRE